MSTVALLAVGSVIMAVTADGASSGVRMDDVTWFFTHPSPWHMWFYLLLPVLALYGLNTLLSTWFHVVATWRQGVRRLRFYAPAVMHVAFLVALAAHLVGGLYGEETGVLRIGPFWTAMPDGTEARVASIDESKHPNGQVRQAVVTLDLRTPDGIESSRRVWYNGPITDGWGSELTLLVRHQWIERHGTRFPFVLLRTRKAPGTPIALVSAILLAVGVVMMGRRWIR